MLLDCGWLAVHFPKFMVLGGLHFASLGMGSEIAERFMATIIIIGLFQATQGPILKWSFTLCVFYVRAGCSGFGENVVFSPVISCHSLEQPTSAERLGLLNWSTPEDKWI